MKNKKYKCLTDFYVPVIDEDGFIDDEKHIKIEKDSIWTRDDEAISWWGSELVLNNEVSSGSIEISFKKLEECFEECGEGK